MFRTSAGTHDPRDQPCRAMISARSVAATVLLALTLVLTACGTTTSKGGSTPGASPTARPPTAVKVYFAHHPETGEHPDQVFAVTRAVPQTMTKTSDLATFALQQMLQGPTTAEHNQGYYSPFSGALALISNCPGPFRDFDLTFETSRIKGDFR